MCDALRGSMVCVMLYRKHAVCVPCSGYQEHVVGAMNQALPHVPWAKGGGHRVLVQGDGLLLRKPRRVNRTRMGLGFRV